MDNGEFLRLFPLRAANLFWFLGAGASASSGVPTAWDLTWIFKRNIYATESAVPAAAVGDLSDPLVRAKITAWLDANGVVPSVGQDDYAYYFERAYPSVSDRRLFIEAQCRGAKPSYGHLVLAALAHSNLTKMVWTTNFDGLVEDAFASLLRPSEFTAAGIESATIVRQCLDEDRWPVVAKLHGDFRSRRLKNTTDELATQDSDMRRALRDAALRFGGIVAGYSGRDESVMDTMMESANAGGFPGGLFWLTRDPAVPKAVHALIDTVRSAGNDAAVVQIGTFDEVLADIASVVSLSRQGDALLAEVPRRMSATPLPPPGRQWPVLRMNALPVDEMPTSCRLVVCDIGGTKQVRQAITDAQSPIFGLRQRSGVITFGPTDELRRVFSDFNIERIDIHAIDPRQLRYESHEHGLIYEAIVRGLAQLPFLDASMRRRGHRVHVIPDQAANARLEPLRRAANGAAGSLADGTIWAEGLDLRLQFTQDRLWLVLDPRVELLPPHGAQLSDVAKEFRRERLAKRYNSQLNRIVDAWIDVFTSGKEQFELNPFPNGFDPECRFIIGRVTAWSRRR